MFLPELNLPVYINCVNVKVHQGLSEVMMFRKVMVSIFLASVILSTSGCGKVAREGLQATDGLIAKIKSFFDEAPNNLNSKSPDSSLANINLDELHIPSIPIALEPIIIDYIKLKSTMQILRALNEQYSNYQNGKDITMQSFLPSFEGRYSGHAEGQPINMIAYEEHACNRHLYSFTLDMYMSKKSTTAKARLEMGLMLAESEDHTTTYYRTNQNVFFTDADGLENEIKSKASETSYYSELSGNHYQVDSRINGTKSSKRVTPNIKNIKTPYQEFELVKRHLLAMETSYNANTLNVESEKLFDKLSVNIYPITLPGTNTKLWHVREYLTEYIEGQWIKGLATDSLVNKDGVELYVFSKGTLDIALESIMFYEPKCDST